MKLLLAIGFGLVCAAPSGAMAQLSPGVPGGPPGAPTTDIVPSYDSRANTTDVCARVALAQDGRWIVRKPIQLVTGDGADYSVLRYETGETVPDGRLPGVGDLGVVCRRPG